MEYFYRCTHDRLIIQELSRALTELLIVCSQHTDRRIDTYRHRYKLTNVGVPAQPAEVRCRFCGRPKEENAICVKIHEKRKRSKVIQRGEFAKNLLYLGVNSVSLKKTTEKKENGESERNLRNYEPRLLGLRLGGGFKKFLRHITTIKVRRRN